jgi:hypothetical protein
MVINAIMPCVNTVVGFVVPMIKQKLDNGNTDDVYNTKQTSMGKFKAIYSGVEYLIHFKYSDALNITYITFMYGLGMPILFPVAALNLFLTYLGERITVAYNVKQPPAMDDSLNNNIMGMIKLAPLFFLFNGYWMISNRQIFENMWTYKDKKTDSMKSHHHVTDFPINWATPIHLLCFASFIVFFLQVFFKDQL